MFSSNSPNQKKTKKLTKKNIFKPTTSTNTTIVRSIPKIPESCISHVFESDIG